MNAAVYHYQCINAVMFQGIASDYKLLNSIISMYMIYNLSLDSKSQVKDSHLDQRLEGTEYDQQDMI